MSESPSGSIEIPARDHHNRRGSLARALVGLGAALILVAGSGRTGDLTREERLKAQEAIQRVYYSHQVGATLSFEEAYPREVLERQVEEYLKKSAALETYWRTPVTAAALRGELDRISMNTRLPERLQEIYAALDNNPVLIEECFARPALVDRLTRSFFSTDQRVHAAARQQAEALRDRLVRGNLALDADDAHRTVIEMVVGSEPGGARLATPSASQEIPGEKAPERRSLPQSEFLQWRSGLPGRVGEAGPLSDRDEAFVFQVVVAERSDWVRVATYAVAKRSWPAWWEENRNMFPEGAVRSVASRTDPVPVAAAGADGGREPATFPGMANAGSAPIDRSRGDSLVGKATGEIVPLAPDCLQGIWDNGSLDDLPDARSQHTAVWTGTEMIIWGGRPSTQSGWPVTVVFNTGWRYNPLTDTWTPISTLNAPSGRVQHTAIWTGTEMIVWGGTLVPDNIQQIVDTGGRYNPSTDTWTPTSMGPAGKRAGHTAIWTGSQMIIWGGLVPGNVPRFAGRYDPATNTWPGMTPSPTTFGDFGRYDHTAVWTGTEMIVWGGVITQPMTAGMKYNPATDVWSLVSGTGAPPARKRHGAVWTGSRMIVWGGMDNTTALTSGGQYDPVTNTWTSTSTTGAPTGIYPASFWTGDRMLVWTGSLATQYAPLSDVWTPTSSLNAPSFRSQYSAVWTGSRMIVWGGISGFSRPLESGARYEPATDTWTPTSLSKVPAARESHTAVWTGNLMIVWGGYDHSTVTYLDTGGRYDPLTDSWSPTSTLNAPFGRSGHSAVWSGTYMIVWGTGSANSPTNTGGRYDPATDTWSSVRTNTAPAPRWGSTAIWTGSRMVIWGGRDQSATPQYLNTGGRYNPANDTWTSTTTTNAPAGRTSHSAVWTGNTMIVWGGLNGTSNQTLYLNTGGRYDPGSDTWSSLDSAAAPDPRRLHSAVWTGARMVVWGGSNAGWSQFTGGQYNPDTNQWTPITTIGVPVPRVLASVVWTGTEMVVWGGFDGNPAPGTPGAMRNSGGRYNPSSDTWTSTTTSGAPHGRGGHTAVWTGTEMIVWGGSYYGDERSGGRLHFASLPDVDEDLDGFTFCGGDCNDSNAAIHPGAPEVCNGYDDDCAVGADEGFDQDGDHFTSCGGDCNDLDASINPAVPEVCNGLDENCNFEIDEGFVDGDGDNYAVCLDCNDFNVNIHPGEPEFCNGVDDNCDTIVDNGGDALCDTNPNDCNIGHCAGAANCSNPTHPPSGTPCVDSNACTQSSVCNATGACVGSNPVVCTEPDPCHEAGNCNSLTGVCINQNPKPLGAPCNDGDPCTMFETCSVLLTCVGAPKDADFDGQVDAACGGYDCNDSNYLVWSFPLEVTNLVLTTAFPADPTWDSQGEQVGPETLYDLTSGMLTGLGGLDSGSSVCLAPGTGATNFSDTRDDPAAGSGFWYLTRARNSCGIGTYGYASSATERSIPACP